MMRALRPDRMTYAVMGFVEEKLGSKFVENRSVEFAKSYEESGKSNHLFILFKILLFTFKGPSTPIFFILSPGVNPLKDVETLGKRLGFSAPNKNFHNVSLGQGQVIRMSLMNVKMIFHKAKYLKETVAEDAMATASRGKNYFTQAQSI